MVELPVFSSKTRKILYVDERHGYHILMVVIKQNLPLDKQAYVQCLLKVLPQPRKQSYLPFDEIKKGESI